MYDSGVISIVGDMRIGVYIYLIILLFPSSLVGFVLFRTIENIYYSDINGELIGNNPPFDMHDLCVISIIIPGLLQWLVILFLSDRYFNIKGQLMEKIIKHVSRLKWKRNIHRKKSA